MKSNLYGQLFKYREREAHSPLENYLTEALCDLLNRMQKDDPQAHAALLRRLFHYDAEGTVLFETQYAIPMSSRKWRIPDLVGWNGKKLALLVEVKVDAEYSRTSGASDKLSDTNGESEESPVNEETQLVAYGKWLKENHPGAKLVLLTYKTPAPHDFHTSEEYGIPVINRHVCWWQDVYDALDAHIGHKALSSILAEEFCLFLQMRGIAMKYFTINELGKLDDFLKDGTASSVQNFMTTLRERLKAIAQGATFSWEMERNYQNGGKIIGNYALLGWVQTPDMSFQIAWGFYFQRGSDDPFRFKLFDIPQVSGIFLNIFYAKEEIFSKSRTPKGEDWHTAPEDIPVNAPAVAFRALNSFENAEKMFIWFQDKFKEACASLEKE